jgi:hypothetical protein
VTRTVRAWLQRQSPTGSPLAAGAALGNGKNNTTKMAGGPTHPWTAFRAGTAVVQATCLAACLPPGHVEADEKAALARIGQDPEAARVMGLTRRFADLVRGASVKQPLEQRPTGVALDDWLAEARCCGDPPSSRNGLLCASPHGFSCIKVL